MKNLMEKIISEVTDHKAECDLILTTSKSMKLSAQNNSLSEYKVSSAQVLGIRLIKDDKVGISYTESLDEASLRLMVKEALENAATNDPSPHEKILQLSGEISDEILYHEAKVDIAEKIERVIELESSMKKADARVVAVPYNGYTENEYRTLYLSSRGRFVSELDSSHQIWTSALMAENNKKASFSDYSLTHLFKELEWEKISKTSLAHASDLLKERVIPTGKYPVYFTPDMLRNMMQVFAGLFSAKAVMNKVNPWGDKLGQQVASVDLSIEDQPLYEKSFRITKVDSEGLERRPLMLVQNGVLNSFYHNSLTANHFATQSTAHASRGPQSSLGISGTTMILRGQNIRPMPPSYLEIIQLDGLHAGTNQITGEFSLGVKGYLWRNGERTMTFGNVTLSGNFFEMLKNVEVTGQDLTATTDRSFFSVPLIFSGLAIAGS
jgi:PmbA protein